MRATTRHPDGSPLTRSTLPAQPEQAPAVSVVVPIYNERPCLDELTRRLAAALEEIGETFEVVLVDNGCYDGSLDVMREIRHRDPRFKILSLSRNFGHQGGVTAGLDFAQGAAVVIIDGDLQDPPELIPELYRRYREGYDVVYAVRTRREKESWFKLTTARWFYRTFRWATAVEMPMDTGDFRLMSRRVVEAVRRMREQHRMLRAMVSWTGFKQVGVPYERAGRFAGETKYPLGKLFQFAFDGITAFSAAPLKLASWLGLTVSASAFLYASYAIMQHWRGETVPGWTSLAVVTAFIGGVQLVCIGILGEYLGRVYDEVKARPLYLVSEAEMGDTHLD